MTLQIVTAATVEPLTLAEAKRACRIDADLDDEDADILELIKEARDFCEKRLEDRALLTQTWDYLLPTFPAADRFKLPKAPAQSITSITYYDDSNTLTTLATTVYQLIADTRASGLVELKVDQSWPATAQRSDAVKVRFVAGFGSTASSIPPAIRRLLKMLVAHWHRNREAVLTGTISKEIEFAVEAIANQNCIGTYS